MSKLQEYNGRFHLPIPVSIVKFMGWKKGEDLLVTRDRSGVVMIVEVKK